MSKWYKNSQASLIQKFSMDDTPGSH